MLTILDGAMGTMIQKMGLDTGDMARLLLTRSDIFESIHRQYLAGGARIVYASTFSANRLMLGAKGYDTAEIVTAAVRAARNAAKDFPGALVALDIGPLGTMVEPLGTLEMDDAVEIFAEIARAGAKAGADLAVIETMTDLQEARAALIAVKENTALPAFVTMSFEESGRTYTGCTVASMARTLTGLGADAIGFNCSLGPAQMADLVSEARRHTRLPIIAKPNAGLPDPVTGAYRMDPETFAKEMEACVSAGAKYVGGCCGTSPEFIAALAKIETDSADIAPEIPGGVCSATKFVSLESMRVIGERVNPTGKKRLQQALREGDLDFVVDLALQQQDAGADILDVNVGCPGVDEAALLPQVVRAIQAACDLPLMIDSGNAQAIEAALRVYCGKAVVNSINGNPDVLGKILPIAAKYGAAVVGLAMDESGLPTTAQQRLDIAQRLREATRAAGVPDCDLWIDPLTLTVSAQQDQAVETLSALRRIRTELELHTVLGVSNISFGLPNRPLMITTFLAMALQAGLSLAIVNPNSAEIMDALSAYRALCGEDVGCAAYVARFADRPKAESVTNPVKKETASSILTLEDAVCKGLQAEAARMAAELLAAESAMAIVENRLIPALDRVGRDYECGKAFLPQLLFSAKAAQAVFAVLKEHMSQTGDQPVKKGRIVLATVKGDIHDIGKNIVATLLENYGWDVIDLGKDVPAEAIAAAVKENNALAVGLSALMTTTLPAMEEAVAAVKALKPAPFVMVGGAVVTADYAASIGADGYAKDAREAAEVLKAVMK